MRVARHPRLARAVLALAASLISAGLTVIAAPAGGTATSLARGTVVLSEWKLVPAQPTVRAGRVTFVVRNDGSITHEFVVLRSERRAGALPVKGGKAVEKGRTGRIAQIPSGATKQLTLTLQRGRYVLLCNLLGHYQAGQFAGFRAR